jgi:hypothetical protein
LAAPVVKSVPLTDQYERAYRLDQVVGRGVAIVIGGDQRKTDAQVKSWATALTPVVPAGAALFGLVNLEALPFFVPNSAIRSSLRESMPKVPVLCDWSGNGYRAVAAPSAEAWVAVYRDGQLLGRVVGTYDAKRLAEVQALFPAAAPPAPAP